MHLVKSCYCDITNIHINKIGVSVCNTYQNNSFLLNANECLHGTNSEYSTHVYKSHKGSEKLQRKHKNENTTSSGQPVR